MELRHLRYFVAVAEELHFGRAAARLGIAQPPLSLQIRKLERELGVQLLERTRRRVGLTNAGRVFLKEAQATLAQAEHAARAARGAGRGQLGHLIIGFVPSASYYMLPLILRTFHRRFPGVEISLQELNPASQVQRLGEARIHVGFFRSPVSDPALCVEAVFQEPLLVALPETHRLAARRRLALSEIAQEPFVLFPRAIGPGFYDQIVSLCQQSGFSPHVAQEASDMQTAVSLVAAGMGVALVPASYGNFRRVGVVYKRIGDPRAKTVMAAAWRADDRSPVLHSFLRIVREVARQLRKEPWSTS